MLNYIEKRTKLIRKTILQIIEKSGRQNDFFTNPQKFLDYSVKAINDVLCQILANGIMFNKISEELYEMKGFDGDGPKTNNKTSTLEVYGKGKTLVPDHNGIIADESESNWMDATCFKIPKWFKVETPIGFFDPAWALAHNGDQQILFVADKNKVVTDTHKNQVKSSAKEQPTV